MSASRQFCPDTNVLLRLQDVGALGIISSLTSCELIITDIVWHEATRKPGVGAAAKKILSGINHVVKRDFMPNEPDTLMFEKLRNQYPESHYQRWRVVGDRLVGRRDRARPDRLRAARTYRGMR